MTLQPIEIQTHLTYQLANTDLDFLKFYASKTLGNHQQLTAKFNQSWRDSYKECDFRRVFFTVLEKLNHKIQSLQGEISRLQQSQKQLKNYQQFKDYLLIIERFNLIENSKTELKSYSKIQDPFDRKCAEIVQKMRYLEEKYTPVVENEKLRHRNEQLSIDLEVYQKSLQYIHEPSMLKNFLSHKENLLSLKPQQVQKLNKIAQVVTQLERFGRVFEYYETNLSQISHQLKMKIICLDGVRKMIQIPQQSGNKWVKQNKYLRGAHVCLSNLIENIQKSKQQITGHIVDKIKFEASIKAGTKQIVKAFLHLLEANFSETSIGNLIEAISKYTLNSKEIEVFVSKIIEIGSIEKKLNDFQTDVEAIWINQLSTLDKPIAAIKIMQKNSSVFSWSLDHSRYHDKQQIKLMKNMLQTSLAKKLLIHIGEQKKLNLKDPCLPKLIRSYSSQLSSQFSEGLKRIDERKDRETKYLQAVRLRLGEIYFSLLNKRYQSPNNNPNAIEFYMQMKTIADQLAKQTDKSCTEKNKFTQNSPSQKNRSVNNLLQEIEDLKQQNQSLQQQNKSLQQGLLNSNNQLDLMKVTHNNCENNKSGLQQSIVNLQNKIALLQGQKQRQVGLKVKYERQKQTQLKLKQQAFQKLQKLSFNFSQQQSKHQANQKQLNNQIKQLDQQLKKQKQITKQLQSRISLMSTNTTLQTTISTLDSELSLSASNIKNESQQQKDKLVQQMMDIFVTIIDKINLQKSKQNKMEQKVLKSINSLQLKQKINSFIIIYKKYLTQHSILSNQQMNDINSLISKWFLPQNKIESSIQPQELSNQQCLKLKRENSDQFQPLQLDEQAKLRQEVKQKQAQIDKQKQTNILLLEQIGQLTLRLKDEIKNIGQMVAQNGKLKGQLEGKSYQLQQYKVKTLKVQKDLLELKQHKKQNNPSSTNLVEDLIRNASLLQKQKQSLQNQSKTTQQQMIQLQQKIRGFELKEIKQQQEINQLKQTIQDLQKNKEQIYQQMNERLNQKQKLIDQIKKQNQVHLNNSELKDHQSKQKEQLTAQLDQQKNRNIQLTNRINELEKLSFDYIKQIGQLSTLKQNLHSQLTNLNKELEQNKLVKERQLVEREKQIRLLNQTIQRQNINKTQLLKQLDEIKNQTKTLKNQINQLNVNHSDADKLKNKELNDYKLRLTGQIAQLNNSIQQLNKQKQKLNQENRLSREKVHSLESQNQQQKSNIQKLITQNSQLITNNKQFEKNNEFLLNKSAKLQIELKNAQQKFNSQYAKLKQSIQQKLIDQKTQLQQQFQLKLEQTKKQQQQQIVEPQQQNDFSQVTDVDTLQKEIKSKTKSNRNLLSSNYQFQEQIEQLKGQKSKISKDLLETKKSIDQIKKSHLQQIKKLTIQRNRVLQAVEKQKKAAEFKAKIEKNNTHSDSMSQAEKLEFGKTKSDLENEKKQHKNNIEAKNKEILSLNQRINQLVAQNESIKEINYEQKQRISSFEQIVKVINKEQNYKLTGDEHTIIFDRFFSGECMDNEYTKKYQLFDLIQSKNNKYIQKTKLLYRFDPLNPTNFHNYIDGLENFLLIVKTPNCILGAFSTSKMEKKFGDSANTISFLFSFADPKKIRAFDFNPNRIKGSKALSFDDFFLTIGNSQIRLRFQEKKVASNFGIQNAFFETNGYTVSGFLNEGILREADLVSYECFQVIFK